MKELNLTETLYMTSDGKVLKSKEAAKEREDICNEIIVVSVTVSDGSTAYVMVSRGVALLDERACMLADLLCSMAFGKSRWRSFTKRYNYDVPDDFSAIVIENLDRLEPAYWTGRVYNIEEFIKEVGSAEVTFCGIVSNSTFSIKNFKATVEEAVDKYIDFVVAIRSGTEVEVLVEDSEEVEYSVDGVDLDALEAKIESVTAESVEDKKEGDV